MTPLLPHCSLEQARGSWNSEEAWAVISVGRDPTLGSLLSLTSHCGWTAGKRAWEMARSPRLQNRSNRRLLLAELDYWHLRTLSQRSSQQSSVSVDLRLGGVSGASEPLRGSPEEVRRTGTCRRGGLLVAEIIHPARDAALRERSRGKRTAGERLPAIFQHAGLADGG